MKIRCYEVYESGERKYLGCFPLAEMFDGDADQTREAETEIAQHKRMTVGGGAAPEFLLVLAE